MNNQGRNRVWFCPFLQGEITSILSQIQPNHRVSAAIMDSWLDEVPDIHRRLLKQPYPVVVMTGRI